MSIHYKLVKINDNITRNQTPRYSVTTVSRGNINLRKLSKQLSLRSTLTAGDVNGVVSNLLSLVAENLKDGNTVTIDGLGTFYPTAELNKEVSDPTKVRSEAVQLKSIAFRPSAELKEEVAAARFEKLPE